ncbi:MAG TPA: hypothetical protein VFW00_07300 [Rhodocyclaceae bacterium]|nr:hypothetical protein [Rhodocyclaceae bacterium]
MKKISSGSLFITKKIFPIVWFGFLTFFVIQSLALGAHKESYLFLLVPCLMGVFGYFMMKKIVWDLVDEAYDCGDYLLFRNGKLEDRVLLSDIMNVSASTMVNPPRITLRLRKPSKFGTEISFSPMSRRSLNPFRKNAIAEDLIVRVDQARLKRVG